jgi:hypothetical protein
VAAGTALAFRADGQALVTVIGSEKATIWDVTARDQFTRLDDQYRTGAGPGRFKVSPDGRVVVSARYTADTIDVWTIR